MKNLLVVVFVCSFVCASPLSQELDRDKDNGVAKKFEQDAKSGKLTQRTDEALNNLIIRIVGELRKQNVTLAANAIEAEWRNKHQGFIYDYQGSKPIGDHPAIQWLLDTHSFVEGILGEEACKRLRLHDLWYFAYTIPMVFRCVDKPGISKDEYGLHMTSFVGCTTYWLSVGTCMGINLVVGVSFGCSLIGVSVEKFAQWFVAPPLTHFFYPKVCSAV